MILNLTFFPQESAGSEGPQWSLKKKTENTKKIELTTWRNYILDLKVLFHYDFKSRLPLEYTHFDNSGTCDEALQ